MPFGAGHRACLGRNNAQVEIQKMVVSLLRRYDVTLVEEQKVDNGMPPTSSFGMVWCW